MYGITDLCNGFGMDGLEDGVVTVCCHPECPQCGGTGCKPEAVALGLTDDDCCIGNIASAGPECLEGVTGPCKLLSSEFYGECPSWNE